MVTIWVLGVGFAILAFVGLIVVDGGTVLHTRSQAFSIAGAAARAGAQNLEDPSAIYGEVRIDHSAARAAALDYLAAQDLDGTVTIDGNRVTVTVDDVADLAVYPGSVSVTATATAVAVEPDSAP
jgi:hypothetical protein